MWCECVISILSIVAPFPISNFNNSVGFYSTIINIVYIVPLITILMNSLTPITQPIIEMNFLKYTTFVNLVRNILIIETKLTDKIT